MNSRIFLCVCALLAATLTPLAGDGTQAALIAKAEAADFQGDVYILGGGFGVFSTGLKQLRLQLQKSGVKATQVSYQAWRSVAQKIEAHRNTYGRKPVVLIGHSLGANNAVLAADALKKKGVQVDLIVSYASTAPMTVPSNVRNVINYYFKSQGWGGVFTAGSGFSGSLKNVDMSLEAGKNHFNVDDDPALRDQVVSAVLRYVRPSGQ